MKPVVITILILASLISLLLSPLALIVKNPGTWSSAIFRSLPFLITISVVIICVVYLIVHRGRR